jgi:dipeptidyl aminopeptidase/acylaminoacyl peptidase
MEVGHRWPCFLPDGRHFLYHVQSLQEESGGIYIGSLDGSESKRLSSGGSSAAYGPPGYLLFVKGASLMAQLFDPGKLELSGEAFPIAEDIGSSGLSYWHGPFSVSETGVLVYKSAASSDSTQLVWFDGTGKELDSFGMRGDYIHFSLSPDEKSVSVMLRDSRTGTEDVWLGTSMASSSRFTFDPAEDRYPFWSRDGDRIVFCSNRNGPLDLFLKSSSGAGQAEPLFSSPYNKFPSGWSLDGRFIAYQSQSPEGDWDLWILSLENGAEPTAFLQTEFDEGVGRFSPDGRWMAYVSNESGICEVYVQPFPPSGGKYQVSMNGGEQPVWRSDGKELFYLTPDGMLMAVPIDGTSPLELGSPRALFQTRLYVPNFGFGLNYAVSADGQRFLMQTPVKEVVTAPINVVLNWTAGLGQ